MIFPAEANEEFESWKVGIFEKSLCDWSQKENSCQAWVGANFTWLYVGSQDVWFFFMIAVYVYYGNIRLGDSESKPEYNNISWFTMLFACGVGVGESMIGRCSKNCSMQEIINGMHQRASCVNFKARNSPAAGAGLIEKDLLQYMYCIQSLEAWDMYWPGRYVLRCGKSSVFLFIVRPIRITLSLWITLLFYNGL